VKNRCIMSYEIFHSSENGQKDQSVGYIFCEKSPKLFVYFHTLPGKHSAFFLANQFLIKFTDFILLMVQIVASKESRFAPILLALEP
jgi:hypothetical protein